MPTAGLRASVWAALRSQHGGVWRAVPLILLVVLVLVVLVLWLLLLVMVLVVLLLLVMVVLLLWLLLLVVLVLVLVVVLVVLLLWLLLLLMLLLLRRLGVLCLVVAVFLRLLFGYATGSCFAAGSAVATRVVIARGCTILRINTQHRHKAAAHVARPALALPLQRNCEMVMATMARCQTTTCR